MISNHIINRIKVFLSYSGDNSNNILLLICKLSTVNNVILVVNFFFLTIYYIVYSNVQVNYDICQFIIKQSGPRSNFYVLILYIRLKSLLWRKNKR